MGLQAFIGKPNRGWRILVGGMAMLTLAACATEDPRSVLKAQRDADALERAPKAKSPFNRALQENYLSLAETLLDSGDDNLDGGYFARKGIRAANDYDVLPEDPAFWPMRAGQRSALKASRRRLMTALDSGAREQAPEAAAKAQVSYDCWVDDASDYAEHTSQCENDHIRTMAQLKKYIGDEPEEKAAPAPQPQPKPQPQGVTLDRQLYIILFDLNSAELSYDAVNALNGIAASLKSYTAARIKISGHTDTLGSDTRNLQLSQQRASIVARTLVAAGVPSQVMQIMWQGEADPAVPTPDGRPEQINRRVVVEVTAAKR